MIENLLDVITRTAIFLETCITIDQKIKLENHLKFENFKNNKSVNVEGMRNLGFFKVNEQHFVRKGKSGGWKEYFNEEERKELVKWVEDNQKIVGIKFKL